MFKSILRILLLTVFLVSSAFAVHLDGVNHNGIVYLLRSAPDKIARYDLTSQAWLADIPLNETSAPTAFAVDDSGIYVGFNRIINRYPLNGGAKVFVTNTSNSVRDLEIVGDYLAVCSSSELTTIHTASLRLAGTYSPWYSCVGISAALSRLKIFSVSSGISPADINYFQLDQSGLILSQTDSQYHGDYAIGSRTWVFANESKVVDTSGNVYSTDNLQHLASLAGNFQKIAFAGDLPIVLRGNTLTAYSNTLLESGTYTLSTTPVEVFATAQDVVAVQDTGAAYSVERVVLSSFATAQPNAPIDPTALPYTADDIQIDRVNQVVYLLSKAHQSIFRWSINEQRYLDSLSLTGTPNYFSVDPQSGVVYVAYQSGKINKLDLGALPASVESPFTALPSAPWGLAQVGQQVFAADSSGAWGTHYIFNGNGQLVSSKDWNYFSSEYIWSSANNKLYFFRDDTSPNDILWESIDPVTGAIGDYFDSPYHGDFPAIHPIRISSDGRLVIIGSGRVFDAQTLRQTNSIANNIIDADWSTNTLVTLKANVSDTVVQFWDSASNFAPGDEVPLSGTPLRVFYTDSGVLVIRQVSGAPVFAKMSAGQLPDADSDGIHDYRDNCPATANALQEDYDSDGVGDTCDTDADNDGLPNSYEESVGFNPLNADDATLDADNDGVSNLREYLLGSDPLNPASMPPSVNDVLFDFEDGLFPANFSSDATSNQRWVIDTSTGAAGSVHSLRAAQIGDNQSAGIVWADKFQAGLLEFDLFYQTEDGFDFVYLYIDEVLSWTYSGYSAGWQHASLRLSAGDHVIRFVYVKDGSVSYGEDTVRIDNLRYRADSTVDTDRDGVYDRIDNCPAYANLGQADVDGDGIGDRCDNCTKRRNRAQVDSDRDGYGNACDGDFNNDKRVDDRDLVRYKRATTMLRPLSQIPRLYDLNADGRVNERDRVLLMNVLYKKAPGPSGLVGRR